MCWRHTFSKTQTEKKRMFWETKMAAGGGFTLLEVLVSMAILAVVIAAVYEAFISNVASVKAARQGQQVNQTARIVLERLSQDLVCAVAHSPEKPDGVKLGMVCENREDGGHPADQIDFTSFSHLTGPGGGHSTDLCEIGYSLEKDPSGKGLILFRRDVAPPDEDFLQGGRRSQLARNVGGLNFRFMGNEEQVEDSWNTLTGETKGVLPSLVTIELTVLDDEGKEHLFVTSIHPALAPLGGGE